MKGTVLPPEWRRSRDQRTGGGVLQWTAGETMNHNLYFTNPSVSRDGKTGFFVSYRTGYPNLYCIDLESGVLRRLTDKTDINPFSPVPALNSFFVFFSARDRVYRLNTDSGQLDILAVFPGSRLGICSLSNNNLELAVGVRRSEYCELAVVDTQSGKTEICLRAEEVGHVQFCPSDALLLLFSGPARKRLWCHDRRTGMVWRVLSEGADEWFIHESWLGMGPDILFVRWPYALLAVAYDGSGLRKIAETNAWHPRSDSEGNRIVFDTNHPDRGLLMMDRRTGRTEVLCYPGASRRGRQWSHDLPADAPGIDTSIIRSDRPESDMPPRPEDPETLYGPQWTHPHPGFSPDGKQIVFTSDRDRYSHVYSLAAPDLLIEKEDAE